MQADIIKTCLYNEVRRESRRARGISHISPLGK
jgi:hypothetical protein